MYKVSDYRNWTVTSFSKNGELIFRLWAWHREKCTGGPGTEGEQETPGPSGLSLTFHLCLSGVSAPSFISRDPPPPPSCKKRKRLLSAAPGKKEYKLHLFFFCQTPREGLWQSWLGSELHLWTSQDRQRTRQLDAIRFTGRGGQFQKGQTVVELTWAVSWGDKIITVCFHEQAKEGRRFIIIPYPFGIFEHHFFFPTEEAHCLSTLWDRSRGGLVVDLPLFFYIHSVGPVFLHTGMKTQDAWWLSGHSQVIQIVSIQKWGFPVSGHFPSSKLIWLRCLFTIRWEACHRGTSKVLFFPKPRPFANHDFQHL